MRIGMRGPMQLHGVLLLIALVLTFRIPIANEWSCTAWFHSILSHFALVHCLRFHFHLQGPSDAERGDLLSPLRRGSKGWYVGQQEEQFLRGRLVTSPPGMVKSDDAAERTSTTPTICSQKYNRQLSFDLTSVCREVTYTHCYHR